jgi:MoaA/NifB/PqqE/SkfB family radical SAM enzyme
MDVNRIGIWDITSKCNLRCAHCYNQERYWDKAESYKELSITEIEQIINKLSNLSFTRIHLLGGEPLMAKNLEHLVLYAKKLNLEVTMVTNGTLLDEKMFYHLCNWGVTSISISIDGTNAYENDKIRGDGVFENVIRNLKKALEIKRSLNSKIYLYLSFTLTKKNYRNSYNLPEFAERLGLDSVSVSYLSNEGEARKDFDGLDISLEEKFKFIDKVIQNHKKHRNVALHIDSRSWLAEYIYKKHGESLVTDELGCKGGNKQFYILADGSLLPCSPSGTSMGKCLDKILGNDPEFPNLIQNSVEDIINSKSHICFYNYTRSKETYQNIYPCNQCKYTCTACPLLYQKHKIVDECVLAQKKVKEIDSETMLYRFKKEENIRTSDLNDRIEILDFINQNIYTLDETALMIWEKINGKSTVKEIAEEIYLNFQNDPSINYAIIEEDVLEYIYHLKSLELIY